MAGVTQESWLQAQYSVLGSALIDPNAVGAVITGTSASDYSASCQTVYEAIRQLYSEGLPADVVSVANRLGQGYAPFLKQLMEITPTAANVQYYISLCKSQARVLALREIGGKLASAEKEDEVRELMEAANKVLVEKQSVKVATMGQLLNGFFDRSGTKKSYIQWPIGPLNDRLYAEQGDFIILGGYPSAGKSAFALQCAALWSKSKRVGIYSLETSPEKLFDRLVASVMGISMTDIKRNLVPDEQWRQLAPEWDKLYKLNLEIIPAAGMSPADIKATALARRHEIVIIDYLQLLQGSGSSRYEQVTSISLALHTMAQSLGIMVMALSQLKRQPNSGEAPTMGDLRESGQIEQDADIIFLLYLADQEDEAGDRVLRIAKNKEGTRPGIRLAFDGQHQTFHKSSETGKVVSKYAADGKKARRTAHAEKPVPQQLQMLSDDTPIPEQWRN